MSRKFKAQASSARAASSLTSGLAFGASFQTNSSPLSYITELPDLSQISKPNVVVAFKNLGKKDSTTKTKALEELQESCTGDVEREILQAWADIYPRTSIDNSRRVRQLAHTIQGDLTVSCGKRIAPLLSKVVPSWLAGTLDNDKSVSRSAQDALEKSFASLEKRKAIWSLYKNAILDHIEDAIILQTPKTLSDERTTSADDAEAKYTRVVGTAMNMLARLLRNGSHDDLVTMLLNGKKLWDFAYHEDSYLRRSTCELIRVACDDHTAGLDWTVISTCFVSKGLHSNQSGSSRQYTAALLTLTQRRPEIWTSDYVSKTVVSRRLIQFLKKGSQNGPEDVWPNIATLIRLMPEQAWSTGNQLDSATSLVEAMRIGVTSPSERINAATAWIAYVQTCIWMTPKLTEGQNDFVQQQLAPILNHYILKEGDQQWNITNRAAQVSAGAAIGLMKCGNISAFESIWSGLTLATIDAMKLSHSESSGDFRASQDAVIEQAKRFYSVKQEILKAPESSEVTQAFERADHSILECSIQLLRTRNGKPYSAAGIIGIIIAQKGFNRSGEMIQAFVEGDLSLLLDSPSAEHLASIALSCGRSDVVDNMFAQRSPNMDKAICYVLTHLNSEQMSSTVLTQITIKNIEEPSDCQILAAAMQNTTLGEVHSVICNKIKASISVDAGMELQQAGLTFLNRLMSQPTSASIITSDDHRSKILPNLLLLADSASEISEQANTVVADLNNKAKSAATSVAIIRQQLGGDGTPLSIFTLIDLANEVVHDGSTEPDAIMPTEEDWKRALLPFILTSRPASLSITSPLQGLVYVMKTATDANNLDLPRDQEDFSSAFRLLIYVTKLLTSDLGSRFNVVQIQGLFPAYPIALQLLNEKLTVEESNEMWIQTTPEVLQEATSILAEGNTLVNSWLKENVFTSYWLMLLHDVTGHDMATYTKSVTWATIAAQYIDQYGPTKLLQEYDAELKNVHKSDDLARNAGLISVLGEYISSTAYGRQILNELLACAMELRSGNIKSLVLLNLLLRGDPEALDQIPTRRLVLIFNSLLRLLDDRITPGMQSEVLKLLTIMISSVREIYGEHWEQLLTKLVSLWRSEMDLPVMNSSVRLYARLKAVMKTEDANEDLQDAWRVTLPDLSAGLLDCLQQVGNTALELDQPRVITAELIRRQLQDVELKPDDSLISLLASPVGAVQIAAFEILHRVIPQRQEELAVEVILAKQTVRLPQGLVSLLSEDVSDPRRYLLTWKLIFDHFSNASYKLREAYTQQVKESGHINRLLDHICEVLRIVSGRPIEASRFDIIDFDSGEAESSETTNQWLSLHNYYNTLLYVPGLAKDWFILQKNRIKTPLEAWTQKYISPLIVAASITTVTTWASTQNQGSEEDQSLTVKSSPKSSELTATIAVDPESPPISIAISLPGSYPLESPIVISRTRVGVSEKNWQSWLRTIQIIIFSTGSIIEGLIAFRRNVQGALKGQSECAICYSIIGTDMQTPNKKCGTCKNNFHGTCLFRWFKSSNSSSCPLCRNNFNYA